MMQMAGDGELAVPDPGAGHALERFGWIASRLLEVPMALIALAEPGLKPRIAASWGLSGEAASAAARLCAAIGDEADGVITLGPNDSPLRSAAVAALLGAERQRLGTLCVFDRRSRDFTPTQLGLLVDTAGLAAEHLVLRSDAITAREQLAAINAASPSAIIFATRKGTVTGWNAAASSLLGWTQEELVGKEYALAPPELAAEMERHRRLNLDGGETFSGFQTQRLTRDGRLLHVSISAAPVRDASGAIAGTVVVMDDLTEQKRLDEVQQRRSKVLELAANDAPLTQIFEHLVAAVEFGIPGGICTILRCKGNALEHKASGPALPPMWIEAIAHARIGPNEGSCGTAAYYGQTIIVDDIATDPRWETPRPLALELNLRACWSAPIRNAQGVVHGTLAVYSDRPRQPTEDQLRIMHEAAHLASIAIEGQRTRDRLEDLALRDTLTGLPNRAVFQDRLRESIAAAKQSGERVFIGLLDLDRFKVINDTLGHVVGDQLLIEVANRLRRAARPQDTIARMGGDEFLFLLTGVENRERAETVARRILGELDASFSPSGNELFVHASLGFSVYPDDATDPTQLLRLADRVMYDVKARGSSVGFYKREAGAATLPEISLETGLNRALETREFILHYQPQIERGNRVRSAEAHVHWNHPQLGLLARDRFMAVADEAGLSVPIGAWMLEEACRFARRWQTAGGSGRVAVNVTARQCRDRQFAATVINAITQAGIVPAQLSLEISEPLIGRSPDGVAATFAELRSYGVHTVIDDFGTGSSSLQHLKRLPIDGVKIDRSFVEGIDDGAEFAPDRTIIETIVGLGRALQLEVAVDGIETKWQLGLVLRSGCDVVQGSMFAPALPEDQFLRWSPSAESTQAVPPDWIALNAERDAIAKIRQELGKTKTKPQLDGSAMS
jgi:diguanylate cyclase (GGDEF)-like protein/PAS domain S-box-containing protein